MENGSHISFSVAAFFLQSLPLKKKKTQKHKNISNVKSKVVGALGFLVFFC